MVTLNAGTAIIAGAGLLVASEATGVTNFSDGGSGIGNGGPSIPNIEVPGPPDIGIEIPELPDPAETLAEANDYIREQGERYAEAADPTPSLSPGDYFDTTEYEGTTARDVGEASSKGLLELGAGVYQGAYEWGGEWGERNLQPDGEPVLSHVPGTVDSITSEWQDVSNLELVTGARYRNGGDDVATLNGNDDHQPDGMEAAKEVKAYLEEKNGEGSTRPSRAGAIVI